MYYYASKISPNMARTPEGFLLCMNVPIARTGKQVYLASELPLDHSDPNEHVDVYRDEADVFTEAAMASFEGKPTVDEHPDGSVTPENVCDHIKGVSTNIRRGQGKDADKLLADLLIYDGVLISEIENGKREVSCGYECEVVRGNNGCIYQKNIVGNHIAVVSAGRAGSRVAIKDESPEIENKNVGDVFPKLERSIKKMGSKRKKPSERGIVPVLANLWPFFNKDAAPEDLTEIVADLVEAIEEEVNSGESALDRKDEAPASASERVPDEEPTKDSDENTEMLKKILEMVESFGQRLAVIEEAKQKDDDPLKKLEDELSGDSEISEDSNEAEFVEPAEQIDGEVTEDQSTEVEETQDEAGVIMPTSGRPTTQLNKDAALKELKRMKPIIAAIPDLRQRKLMSDSLAKMIRATYGISPARNGGSKGSDYAAIINMQRRNATTHRANDSKSGAPARNEQTLADLGSKISASRNPHDPNFKKNNG